MCMTFDVCPCQDFSIFNIIRRIFTTQRINLYYIRVQYGSLFLIYVDCMRSTNSPTCRRVWVQMQPRLRSKLSASAFCESRVPQTKRSCSSITTRRSPPSLSTRVLCTIVVMSCKRSLVKLCLSNSRLEFVYT